MRRFIEQQSEILSFGEKHGDKACGPEGCHDELGHDAEEMDDVAADSGAGGDVLS